MSAADGTNHDQQNGAEPASVASRVASAAEGALHKLQPVKTGADRYFINPGRSFYMGLRHYRELRAELRSLRAEVGALRREVKAMKDQKQVPALDTVHVQRVADGFEVSGTETFFHRASVDTLEHVLKHVVLPVVRSHPDATLPEVLEESQKLADLVIPRIRNIPWTGLSLWARWRSEDDPYFREDAAMVRITSLLGQWYESTSRARRKAMEVTSHATAR